MVEEFVDEHFMKYINNDGRILKAGDSDIDTLKKTDCYCYFSYIKSEGELVVLDIQWCGYTMFDSEVASSLRFFEEGTLFYVRDLKSHICIRFCKFLKVLSYNL